MYYLLVFVLSLLCMINFLSDGMEIKPTQRAMKIANMKLRYAAVTGDCEELNQLIATGVNINIKNVNGCTPLYFACLNNCTFTALALIEAGADVNSADKNGETALVHAVKNKNIKLVNALINAEAQVNVCDRDNESLLRIAVKSHEIGIVKMLIDHGSTQKDGALLMASYTYYRVSNCYYDSDEIERLNGICLDIIKLLINVGVNLNVQSENNSTPLILACFNNNSATALVLIESGADVNMVDYEGVSALSSAVEFKQLETSMALINPVAKPLGKKKIELLLMVYRKGCSWVSIIPKEVLKLIITYAYPEFAMDCQLIRSLHPQILVDNVPLETLSFFIKNSMLYQDSILAAWYEKILSLVHYLKTQKKIEDNAIQQFESDAITKVIMSLTY